jgi:hypothetical protein
LNAREARTKIAPFPDRLAPTKDGEQDDPDDYSRDERDTDTGQHCQPFG